MSFSGMDKHEKTGEERRPCLQNTNGFFFLVFDQNSKKMLVVDTGSAVSGDD